MKTVNDIRQEFLGYFKKNGHTIVPSSSLVPQNDPTLMFTNSGMVQFKDVFTGKEKRDYKRATTAQKCVRAGGKHNDLENVGYTARHHTFFEMLGNFSFGDYFKDDAIAMAWELVTKNFALPPEKLTVTVHSTDEEAAAIWKKVTGFSDHKIIRIDSDDNFWRMGDLGPCGPCTEIFYDHGDHIPGGPPGSPDGDGDRFIEIWNNVFMQYEQVSADKRIDLPAQSVDTGMGLERVAAILQGVHSNYEIDLLDDIIEHIADLTGVAKNSPHGASHRVIADHLRSAAFLMADGVMPSNEGRGYVLRRIMRRGMRHAHILGAKDPLMYRLFSTLLGKMGQAYPELGRAEALIVTTLESEEKRFKVTLERGLKMLEDETSKLSKGQKLAGDVAFKLYDTYGFPLDLTQDALKAQGLSVDVAGFEARMDEQKKAARAAWAGSGDAATETLWFEVMEEVGPTEFLGYESETAEGLVKALVQDGKRVQSAKTGSAVQIVTNQSPFYAESGGQVGDHGIFKTDNAEIKIIDTRKMLGGLFVHVGEIKKGDVKIGEAVQMEVDHARRSSIRANHSATHLLHEALRRVLGEHVSQKGSLQDAERTRFDISHPQAVTPEQVAQVEDMVNKEIEANTPVETRVMALDEARATGAMALFGEKYDDEVRVVMMGLQHGNKQFSVELCGGTHVKKTGEIEKFKIVSEGSLSAGIRRLEAVTGPRVDAYLSQKQAAQQDVLQKLAAENQKLMAELKAMGGTPDETDTTNAEALMQSNKKLQKEISDLRRALASQSVGGAEEAKDVVGLKFLGKVLEGFSAKDLKPMADDLKTKLGSGIIVLIATDEGKASIVVGVTDDLTGRISAVDLVKIGAEALGGKGGGGRPDMAQAGGPNADAANDAVTAIEKALAG
jgi:alanyl-tRNA synthetase